MCPPTISINGGAPFTANAGERLFFALRERGIMLPSACGGRGLCGLCKIKVKSGGGLHAPEELKKLTAAEIDASIRLACRVIIDGNVEVEIDEDKLNTKFYSATLVEKYRLNYDTFRLTLALEGSEKLDFTAGQFIQLEIPPHSQRQGVAWRAYSLANPPQSPDRLEIIVRRVPMGLCTGYLHDIAEVGDKFILNGPHGEFHLRPTPAPALLLAGGSGISPFKSMLADAAAKGVEKPMTLIFAGVGRRDLYDLDLLAGYEKKLPNFRFVPALSNPADDDGWRGEVGLVTEVALRLFPDMTGMEAYLCGSPGMIGACRACLTKAGVSPSNIYFDQFG